MTDIEDVAAVAAEEQALPTPDQVLPYVSWSRMEDFNTCTLKYYLRYVAHTPREPGGALIGGSSMHRAIEASEESGKPRPDVFEAEFDRMLREAGGPDQVLWGAGGTEGPEWWKARAVGMLEVWSGVRIRDEDTGWVAVGDEIRVGGGLAVPGGGEVWVGGRLDQLLMQPDTGFFKVRDWKSGRNNGLPLQPALYGMTLHRSSGLPIEWGEFVNVRTERVDVFPVAPYVDTLLAMIAGHVAVKDVGPFFPQPNKLCPCDVWTGCTYGRSVVAAAADEEAKL